MKLDRLIGILTLLLQREKVTAMELAERNCWNRWNCGTAWPSCCAGH